MRPVSVATADMQLLSRDIKEDNNLVIRTKDILECLYNDTIKLLKESRILLDNISQELLVKETIDENDINRILNMQKMVG